MVTAVPIIELSNTALGIIGLVAIPLGIVAGKKQIETMRAMRDDLNASITDLKGEVETHYIGNFPDIVPRIIKLLDEARESILIFCDLPAYGLVSTPRRFRQYMRTIEDKAEASIPVRMLHLNRPGRMASREIQFKDSWDSLSVNEKVTAFLAKAKAKLDGDDPKAEFLDLIEERQVKAHRRFEEAGVEAKETDLIMPLYFWIVDGKKAVFALTEFGESTYEAGFWTRSKDLIRAMEGIYQRYYDSRTEAERAGEGAAAVIGALTDGRSRELAEQR